MSLIKKGSLINIKKMVINRLKLHGIVMTALIFAGFAYLFSISCSQKDEKTPVSGPVFEVQKIFPVQDDHVHGSTIVELPNGDLLAGWFQGSGERWADDVKIMGSRKKMGHMEWSEPFTLADVKEFPDCNPVLFLDD